MNLYMRFLGFARKYWLLAFISSMCFVTSGFLGAYPIQLFKKAVDIAVGDAAGSSSSFYRLAAFYIVLRFALGGVHLAESYLSKRLVQNVIYDLRSDVYAHLQKLSIGYYESKEAGDIMSRALGDVGAVAGGFMGPMTRLAGELTQLGWALYFLFRINPQLTLIALGIAPPLGYAVYRFGDRMRHLAGKMRDANSKLWSFLMENISGMREIKIFGRESLELQRFQNHSQTIDRLGLQDTTLNAILTFLTGLLFSSGETAILLLGGLYVYQGPMTPGMLTAFLMYVRMLYNPVITISRRYDQTLRTLASAVRVFNILDTPPAINDRDNATDLLEVEGRITFEHVSFQYRADQEVLNDISFTAEPGSIVALVGHSGGGKTTISKLVPRFYDPDQGCVMLDGHDIREYTVKSLRQHIAVVFQEPFLFNSSVRDNIAYGRPEASIQEIMDAAKAANAHDFIMTLPEKYDTLIGVRGVKLSGGQRQRVAIARALLKNPRILILDEATASVDSETEQAIQQALDKLLKGRTNIIIAHRLSTILHADLILVIERGCIVESGIHSALLAQQGVYSKLYNAQFKEPTEKHRGTYNPLLN
jgi:subfamily B ATP-binding cassette protein MsbA